MNDTAPHRAATARNFALRLTFDTPLGLSPELGRLAAGLSISAFYGLALGARAGGAELLQNALGVPLGLVALGAVMMPSLTVLFAILDAPVTPSRVLGALGRALSSSGLVLAGLAPGAALLCVTVESAALASGVAGLGFVLAGMLGLFQLAASLGGSLAVARPSVARKGYLLLAGYGLFTVMLAARLWTAFVPMLGGAS
jgi:hypothetical protein